MLGLGQQIDRDAARIIHRIGEHHDLRGPGDRVDTDATEHLPLGFGDICVARADDPVDRRNAGRAVRQCGDSLRPATAIDLANP